ncbi:helix-turn-helix domain-containing protein [Ferrimonas pelagia]|uniref:TetR/AcrR family transcriptional regulator n=1 Tax=Ferrimonas pelagia TaxID=1177826 RepID=A0ABP9F1R5_9GAMM
MSVKPKKRGRPASGNQPLSKAIILSEAKRLLAQQGKIPSLRALATALEIDPMAIYHYFANKAALLEAVATSLMKEIYQPQDNSDWQGEIRQLSESYLSLLAAHPGLLEIMLGMTSVGPAEVFVERLELALAPVGLDTGRFEAARDLLVDYLHGVALAIQCNPGGIALSGLDGPLALIFASLAPDAN